MKRKLNYIDNLPEEISSLIYHFYLLEIINSNEFKNKRRDLLITFLSRNKSQKQLRHLQLI